MLIAMPVVVLAQNNLEEKAEDISKRMDQWGEKMEAWGQDLEQALENGDIPTPPSLPFGKNADDDYGARPRLGAYIDDMDFVDAYEKHYPYCYGVYISSVVRGGNRLCTVPDNITEQVLCTRFLYNSIQTLCTFKRFDCGLCDYTPEGYDNVVKFNAEAKEKRKEKQ